MINRLVRGWSRRGKYLLGERKFKGFRFCTTGEINESIREFRSLMEENTEQSLEEAAKRLSVVEVEDQIHQQSITQIRSSIQTSDSHIKQVVEKVIMIMNNIEKQKKDNDLIEKRVQKELKDCKDFAMSKVAKEMLDVADALHKCYKLSLTLHGSEDHQAVAIIKKSCMVLQSIFEVYGIEEFDPVGEPYNPNTQQSFLKIPVEEGKKSQTVAYTIRTGYLIKGRLLRSAHVTIYE